MPAPAHRGLTLVELMIALVVLAILATLAVPSFIEMLRRQRVHGAARTLVADLEYARSESQRRRTTVSVSTVAGGATYQLLAGAEKIKTVSLPADVPMNEVTVAFDPLRGRATATAIDLGATGQPRLRVHVAETGRTHVCSPDGSYGGIERCIP